MPIEVRQVMSGPPPEWATGGVTPSLDPAAQDLLRDLAPAVLGTLVRRYRDFAACEDAVQEALLAAADAVAGRPGTRTIRRAGSSRSRRAG